MRKLLVRVVVFVFLFIGVFLLFRYLEPVKYVQCNLERGHFEGIPGPSGGPYLGHLCVHTFSDGGRKCTSSNDCEGACLVTEDTLLQHTGGVPGVEVIGGYGVCQNNDRFNGCFDATIESPVKTCI